MSDAFRDGGVETHHLVLATDLDLDFSSVSRAPYAEIPNPTAIDGKTHIIQGKSHHSRQKKRPNNLQFSSIDTVTRVCGF